ALQRVVLAAQPGSEVGERAVSHFQTTPVELGQRVSSPYEMQRRTALRAGFGECNPSARELHYRQGDPARRFRPGSQPAQATGDHEVDHEKQVFLEPQHDALAEAAHLPYALPFR